MSLLDEIVATPLHSFTTDTLNDLRSAGKQEGLYLELKEKWPAAGVAKTICAFANAYGGFLIIGATQKPDGKIDRFPGLDPKEEWPLRIKDQVVGHISPLPVWDAITVTSPDDPTAIVAIARVEASDETPHVLTDSGVIYQRSPAASDPVKDKATIDQLIARGSGAEARLLVRRDQLLLTPVVTNQASEGGEGWRIEVAAIPSPQVGRAYGSILTASGYPSAGEVFIGPATHPPTPVRPLEDGVLLRSGRYELARYDDGSVFGRFIMPRNYKGNPVPTSYVRALVTTLLEGQARFVPTVWQSFVWVQLRGIGGLHLSTGWQDGHASEGTFTFNDWTHTARIATIGTAPQDLAEDIHQRLWRTVGHPVFRS
jgi:hypothetical protein